MLAWVYSSAVSQITMLICFVVFGSRPIVAGDVYQRRDDVRSCLSYRQINIHILTPARHSPQCGKTGLLDMVVNGLTFNCGAPALSGQGL